MKYYVVDAFSDQLFSGNPAGVCLLESPITTDQMQSIAAENNLSETAFVLKDGDDYSLRWFTPSLEMDLCGHATLGSAFVVMQFTNESKNIVRFHSLSGILTVEKKGDRYEMDFPSRPPEKIEVSAVMEQAVDGRVLEAWKSRDLLLLLESEEQVRSLSPNLDAIKTMRDYLGVIVTAKGNEADFVSRFFGPNGGVDEDPVTGSTHTNLIPFWSERLEKSEMVARQLSKRGGTLYCRHEGDRVKIAGCAVLYLSGEIHVG